MDNSRPNNRPVCRPYNSKTLGSVGARIARPGMIRNRVVVCGRPMAAPTICLRRLAVSYK